MVSLFSKGTIQVVSVTIQTKSHSSFYARFNDLYNDSPDSISRAKSDGDLAFGVCAVDFRRLIGRMRNARANYFKARSETTRFRAFADRHANIFTDRFLVRAVRVASFASSCTSIAHQGVTIQSRIAPWFRSRYLTRARSLHVAFSTEDGIKSSFAATRQRYYRDIFRDLFRSWRLRSKRISEEVRTSTTLMQTSHIIRLRAVSRISLCFPFIICPKRARNRGAFQFGRSFSSFDFLRFKVLIMRFFG